ncbi:uncharacterized protein [Garra rufa]|uniref:uncharacterized protein n=1 Tax=Garra rufa TaxID=137080 RepID=UPI003CCEDBDF
MSEERENDSPSEMSLSQKQSVKSGSHVFSSVSVKSDQSKEEGPGFSEEKTSSTKRLQYDAFDSDFRTNRNFTDKLRGIFQDLENKIIVFLKNELEKFKKILQKENLEYFVTDFNENRCSIKEAALDFTLYFLREMKQDEAADTLEDELFFLHQLKCSLKKKYQCVFEGITKQGDSTLLNNIYTDLYITQGCSEQVNTEHEVRQIEVTSRRHELQEVQVKCKNLFEAPDQEKEIRTVLTNGVAGIGKSVSVQKFVLDWAEGKENQNISFIFPLPFREMNLKEKEKLSLMDLITQFFPETKGLNLTRRNKFKVLFILDGLDEFRLPLMFEGNETLSDLSSPASLDVLLTNLIKGNLLPSALVWITTRPAAASKIPPDCIDRLTEIRGFNDAQKEEYFIKRFKDQKMASEIIDHVKKSKSLFIMCHIPVFCWISATVLQNILEEKRKNDLKSNESEDPSKTHTEDIPKTLTQMYTHFLRFQILQSRQKYHGEYTPDVSWDKDAILSLGKLAFHQLEKNNVIFYDTDLEACGIDVYKASVYSGMCTQIFREETGIILGTMYCFVHLSIQEFIAALYAHLFLDINKKSVFDQDFTEQENKSEIMIDLLKTAVDKALESDNGHLDLVLRFLLGLSLQSNQRLLHGLLTQQDGNDQSKKEIVQYIKQKLEDNLSPERSINLFYCLNELNDQTLVKEIQTHLSKGSLSSADLSPAQWSALAFVLLTSEQELEEFELQKFKKSDECLIRLSTVIKTSKRALLNDCNLTDKSCSALATVLGSDTSLIELNMNNNNLKDSGVKLLCTGLKNIKCKLEILRLSDCSITEEGYKALASALRSNPSHLIELDLTGNDPGQSGVKQLNDLLQDPNCQLKTLRFLGPAADEACQYVTEIVGKNPLLMKELNLSRCELGDKRVKLIAALLQDKHCTLNTLTLIFCCMTDKGCSAVTSALKSNPSRLRELDLSRNKLGDSGVKNLSDLLMNPQFKLEKLQLSNCSITEEGYKALASALRSNPSHLIELDLTGNDPGQSGVMELNDLLQDPNIHLKTLRLLCPAADEAYQNVIKIVGKNPLLLRELNLSELKLEGTHMEQIAALLKDKHCQLNTLILSNCSITEEGYKALASALRSNPSHLIELDLTGNDPGQSGVKELNDLLQDPNCQLKTLRFLGPAADEACQYVTKIVGKNPLLLRELDLNQNELGDSGFENLSDLLMNPHLKLEKLNLNDCDLTDRSCSALATVLCSDNSLKELNMNNNNLNDSGVKLLCTGLENVKCELEILRLSDCGITEEGYKALASVLRSNPSHIIELDLTGNDPGLSGVKELSDLLQDPNCQLKTLRFLSPDAEEFCQYVTKVVGKNPLLLMELNLSKCELVDTQVYQIAALLQDKHCQLNTLLLRDCGLTEESCSALATVLISNHILKELDMSNNNLQDSGVKKLQNGLENTNCTLEKLRLSDCSITEEGYKALASALRSNPSHLIELDLTGNDPGQSGVKELIDLLQDPNCQLKTMRFLGPAADEACQYVTGIVGKNPLFLRDLNLSECELGNTRINQIAALLQDKHCKLNTLILNNSGITEEGCRVLAAALNLNPSNLKELNLSKNTLGNSGMKIILTLFKNVQCRLETLKLNCISVTDEGCAALALAVNSNLRELDLSENQLGNSGITEISSLLRNSECTLQILGLSNCSITEEGYKALASALRSNPSHLIELDLTGNDPGQSGVKELNDLLQDPDCQLKTLRFLSSPADESCQDVNRVLGENLLLLRELNLSESELGPSGLKKLSLVLQDNHCKLNKLMFNCISITEEGCAALASAFNSNPSNLIELDLSGNNLRNSGVTEISSLLGNSQCTLQILRLSNCSVTEEGYKALASALRSNPSHLIELDLTGNDPGQSGVKELSDLLKDPNCQLKTLRFLGPAADEACQYVIKVQGENPLLLGELNMSGHELGDTRVNQIAALLQDKHCQLHALILCGCSITEKQCLILTSALRANLSHLRELDLSGNKIENKGVKHICELLIDSHCKLERLRFRDCDMTDEGCSALTSALKSNPLHLRELDLSENKLEDSGFENLSNLLMNPQCKLEILALFKCSIKEKQCVLLTSALKSNPSHLRELDISGNVLKHTRVNKFYDILKDSHSNLERLRLRYCAIKADDCSALTSALKSNPSHLRELALSGNELGQLGATNLSDLLMNPQCKLEKLDLCKCSITEKQCVILTSALKSNPSHLRELDLSENQPGNSGVENLGALLSSSQCKLEKLHLCGCRITEKQCLILTSALCLNLSYLRELDFSGNKIENKGVQILCDILNNSQCTLERLSLNDCGITDVACLAQSLAETKALLFLKELEMSNNKIGDTKKQLSDVLRDSNCNLSLETEHLLSWRAGVNYIGSFSGWLTSWSKAQEESVESTEQEKSSLN